MWILGSLRSEMLFFLLPGLFSIVVAILSPNLGETSIVYAILATGLIDSGHVYTTAWRTYLNPSERSSRYIYWLIPLIFFFFFGTWYFTQLPYLWNFIVYATLYHHVRQVYGFSKWYQSLNKRSDKISDFFLYALALLPIIIYHFRPGVIGSYYSEQDLFLFPDAIWLQRLLLVYSFFVLSWIIYEARLWIQNTREPNRIFSILYPASIYAYCFLLGQTITQVLFPLLFVHGIAYFGVMGQTLHRTQKKRFTTAKLALVLVLVTATIFGLSESWFEEEFYELNRDNPLWMTSIIIGLSLTPLFCHYAFDALIWKRNHREGQDVFTRP